MTYVVLVVVASVDLANGSALLGWLITGAFFALLAWDLGGPFLRGRGRETGAAGRGTGRGTEGEPGHRTGPGR